MYVFLVLASIKTTINNHMNNLTCAHNHAMKIDQFSCGTAHMNQNAKSLKQCYFLFQNYNSPPSTAINMENNLYIVEKILAKKQIKEGQVLYRVKWKNWPKEQSTWEPLQHLEYVPGLVKKFEAKLKRRAQRKRRCIQEERRSLQAQAQVKNTNSIKYKSQPQQRNEPPQSDLHIVDRNEKNKKQKFELKNKPKVNLQQLNKYQQPSNAADLQVQTQTKTEKKILSNSTKQGKASNEVQKVQRKQKKIKNKFIKMPMAQSESIIDKLIQIKDDAKLIKQNKNEIESNQKIEKLKKIRKQYRKSKLREQQKRQKQAESLKVQQVHIQINQIKEKKQCINYYNNKDQTKKQQTIDSKPPIKSQNSLKDIAKAPIDKQWPFIIAYKQSRGRGRPKKSNFRIEKSVDVIMQRGSQAGQQSSKKLEATNKETGRIRLLHKIEQNIIQKSAQILSTKNKTSAIQKLEPIHHLEDALQPLKSLEKEQSEVIITQGVEQLSPPSEQPIRKKIVRKRRRRNTARYSTINQAYKQKPKRLKKKRSFAQIFLTDNNAQNFPHIFSSSIVRNPKPTNTQTQQIKPQAVQQTLSLLQQLQRCPTTLNQSRLNLVFNSSSNNTNDISIEFINQNEQACLVDVEELEKHCSGWLKLFYEQYI